MRCFHFISSALLILGMLAIPACDSTDPLVENPDATKSAVQETAPAQWTIIFYLAADNEQEAYADATLAQLRDGTAGVTNHPQILGMIDRLSEPGTEVFEIAGGSQNVLQTYPEQNTADGAVLTAFVDYALGLAAHDNVAFVMKSEGLAWRGIGRDNTHDPEVDDQLMPAGAIAEALAGKGVDLLVLEGSIMAFIEVVYELRDAAPVLLATQSKIQPDGLPWKLVIDDLGAAPALTSRELGIAITDDHIQYYEDKGNNGNPRLDTSVNFAAMTVFDQSRIYEVLDAHGNWVRTLWPLLDAVYNLLPHARDLSDVGGWGEITELDYQFDLETFMVEGMRLIDAAGLHFPDLNDAVDEYLTAQHRLIVYERNPEDGYKMKSANGLSIWFPPTWNKYDTEDESDEVFGTTMSYEDPSIGLDWVEDSDWREFLFEYFDRADANLAGNGIGTWGDEPPKPGLLGGGLHH